MRYANIASLTSYPARLGHIAPCLRSIFNQSVALDKVVMYLSKDEVSEDLDTIEKLAQLSHFIEMGSLIAMGFLVIVSIIIVANTIKLTVFNREKEIGIMKYLGATNWFVRAPFIWSGIIIGVLSSAFATGLTHLIYTKIIGIIGSDITRMLSVSIVPAEQLTQVLLVMFLCIGIGIGVIGSAISIRRFLNV